MADAYFKGIQVLLAFLHYTLPLLSQVTTDRLDSSKLTVHLTFDFLSCYHFFPAKQKPQWQKSFVKGVRKMTWFSVSVQLFWSLFLPPSDWVHFPQGLLFILDSAQLFWLLCIYSCKWLCSHTPSYDRQALLAHSTIHVRPVIWKLAYECSKHSCVSGMDKLNKSVNLILSKQYVWQLFVYFSWLPILLNRKC